MLKLEDIKKLEGLLKLEENTLADAIKDEKEVTLTVPDGILSFLPDELQTRESNAIEKAKPGIKTAAIEEAVKLQSTALGLELTGSEKRNIETFATALQKKALADAKIEPNDQVEKLRTQLARKDELIEAEKQNALTMKKDFDSYKFSSKVDNLALANLSEGKVLDRESKLVLFKNRYKVEETEDGALKAIDLKTGKAVEDDKLNARPLQDVIKEFDSTFKDVKEPGRGGAGGAGGGGGNEGGNLKIDEIKEQIAAEGLQKGSSEYWTRFNELLPKEN